MTKQDDQEQQDDDLIAELGYIKVEVVKDHKSRTKYRHCTGEYNDLSVGLMAKILALIHSEIERAKLEGGAVGMQTILDILHRNDVLDDDYYEASMIVADLYKQTADEFGLTTKEERHQREADRNL